MIEIKKGVREQRIKAKLQLEEDIFKEIEKMLSDNKKILRLDKKDYKEKQHQELMDKVYAYFEEIIKLGIDLSRTYDSFKENKLIALVDDIFYHGDGKTLEQRIKNIFYRFPQADLTKQRMYALGVVLITEGNSIANYVIKEKTEVVAVEIVGEDNGECEICEDYIDGEVYEIGDVEEPPYHPNCLCEAIYYDEGDIIEELLK